MEVKNEEFETKGAFYLEENNQRIAEMTYSKAGSDRIIIDHTEVSGDHRNLGLGDILVKAAVNTARDKKISIIPLCAFAKSVFDKNPEFSDVL